MAPTRIKLRVALDRMSATADIVAGPASGLAELQAALASARIVFLLDSDAVAAIAAKLVDPGYAEQNAPIAQGRPAAPGRDGYFEPAFHVGIQPGHISEDGTMDFFDRELLKPIAADDYVGQLHLPVAGVAGKRLDGSEIKVGPVRPSKLQLGPGVRTSGDGRVYAARPGVLLYLPERSIDIAQQHIHQGDVDLRSGNLDMQGALVVGGTVQHMFNVRASADVEIQGGVESGSVYSSASLRIRGTVRGGDSGMICAEGDIAMQQAEGAHVRCGRLLKLASAVNCDLAAATMQVARVLRGGSAKAESSLVVQEAGAPHASVGTLIAAGVPLERPVFDLKRVLSAAKEQRTLQHRAGGVRADGERAKGGKAGRIDGGLERKELEHKTDVAQRRGELLLTAHVHVLGRAHAGVTVQIGAKSLLIEQAVSGTRFSFDMERRDIRVERGGK